MEAVFHESRKVSEVGSVRREGEGFKAKRNGGCLVAKVEPACLGRCLGFTCPSRVTSQRGWSLSPLHRLIPIMPKIKTSRTKKAPEGFEEIEPVGTARFTVT